MSKCFVVLGIYFCVFLYANFEFNTNNESEFKKIYLNAKNGNITAYKNLLKHYPYNDQTKNDYFELFMDDIDLFIQLYNDLLLVKYNSNIAILNSFKKNLTHHERVYGRKLLIKYYLTNVDRFPQDHLFHYLFNKYTLGFTQSSFDYDNFESEYAIFDGNLDTVWMSSNSGVGEWVIIYPHPFNLVSNEFQGIKFSNGNTKNVELYKSYNRVKTMKIELSDGTVFHLKLEDSMEDQLIPIEATLYSYIKLTILDVYPGTKYNYTCIGDMGFLYY